VALHLRLIASQSVCQPSARACASAHNADHRVPSSAPDEGVRRLLKLLLLLFVSFLPFPTRLVAELIAGQGPTKASFSVTLLYGIVLAAVIDECLLVLWRSAVRAKLVRPDFWPTRRSSADSKRYPGLGAYGLIVSAQLVRLSRDRVWVSRCR